MHRGRETTSELEAMRSSRETNTSIDSIWHSVASHHQIQESKWIDWIYSKEVTITFVKQLIQNSILYKLFLQIFNALAIIRNLKRGSISVQALFRLQLKRYLARIFHSWKDQRTWWPSNVVFEKLRLPYGDWNERLWVKC